jgi:hypothetical protein
MGVTAGIFLASILLKEMRYLVYIRYLWFGIVRLGIYAKIYVLRMFRALHELHVSSFIQESAGWRKKSCPV